jgi:hypothetical protein
MIFDTGERTMDRKIAESLMVEMRKLDEILNNITSISCGMPTEQAKPVRQVIGQAVASAYTEIIRPIVKIFPDLDPDRTP